MLSEPDIAILVDVDNTLLDNDRFSADLDARLVADFGEDGRRRYREIYESLRDEFGYADYLTALQRFREQVIDDPRVLLISQFLFDYPFAERLYPHALETLGCLGRLGTTVIVSDGDIVFQPRKIRRSGLWDAVAGRVLIYIHKDKRTDAILRHYPARHHVMIDDKPALLAAMKRDLGDQLTSVFVRQGHYAAESRTTIPAPDMTIDHIGDLRIMGRSELVATMHRARSTGAISRSSKSTLE